MKTPFSIIYSFVLAIFVAVTFESANASLRANKCSDLFTRVELPQISWGSITDYLPATYLADLQKQNIHLSFEVKLFSKTNSKKNNNQSFVKIFLLKNNFVPIGKVTLTQDPQDNRMIHIDDLNLSNPRPKLNSNTIHQTQNSKGMPFHVYQSFKRKLFSNLKEAGFTKVNVSGSQDYTVLQLYLRTLNAEVKSQSGQKKIQYLDELFQSLKKREDLPFKINSRNDFALMMKTTAEDKDQFQPQEKIFNELSDIEKLDQFGMIYSATSDLIAVYRKGDVPVNLADVYLIDPFEKKSIRFIHWSRWSQKGDLSFEVNL